MSETTASPSFPLLNRTFWAEDGRVPWLEWRRGGIGASETPAILGLDGYRTALEVYAAKIGAVVPDDKPTYKQRYGLHMEPLLASYYEEQTARKLRYQQACVEWRRGDYLRATLDGFTNCGRVVEFKTTYRRRNGEIGEAGTDELPAAWLVQVHHQMIAAGAKHADVVVSQAGEEPTIHPVEYQDDLADMVVSAVGEFWDRVQRREPPPAEDARDVKILAMLRPHASGEITFGPDEEAMAEAYLAAKAESSRLLGESERIKARLLDLMGEAAFARTPRGLVCKRTPVHNKERTTTVKAHSYVRFDVKEAR